MSQGTEARIAGVTTVFCFWEGWTAAAQMALGSLISASPTVCGLCVVQHGQPLIMETMAALNFTDLVQQGTAGGDVVTQHGGRAKYRAFFFSRTPNIAPLS